MLEGGSQGVVEVGGTLQTSGLDAGMQGGTISATGDKVSVVSGALLDATGQAGGGNVLVGGGWQGGDPAIASANAVNIASGAVLNASAIQSGKGGTVVAWSDTQNIASVTKVQGTLLARGGLEGGDGGRIETSGRWLSTNGASGDASALKGAGGQWLFDPYDIEVVTSSVINPSNPTGTWTASSTNSQIQNTAITSLLDAGTSVTISTGANALPTDGSIIVNAPIVRSASNNPVSLTFSANKDITINQPITLTGSGSKVQLNAGNNSGNSSVLLASNVSTDILSMDVIGISTISQTAASTIQTNNLRINAPNSDVTFSIASNNFGALATQTKTLNLTSNQGIDRGSLYGTGVYVNSMGGVDGVSASGDMNISVLNGNIFVERSIATQGNLTLNAGASISMASPYIATNTNNPYGPNIILSPSQTISVGATSTGRLYTGGFGNSGAALASYLRILGSGGNNSRYNSDETTSNFTTPIGTGLTAIYRQKPILTVTAPDVTTIYGISPTLATNLISGLVNGDTQAFSVSNVGTAAYPPNLSTAGKQNAGTYSIAPNISTTASGLGYGFTPINGVLTVTQKTLNLTSGITGSAKTYDGTTATSLSVLSPVFSNLETNDVVNVSASGAFADKNVGLNKPINISSVVLSGTDSANYNLANAQTTAFANITPKSVAVAGTTVASKTYDGTIAASLSNGSLLGIIPTDVANITLTQAGNFADKNVGTNKTVTAADLLSGTEAGNYSLVQPTGLTANITAKALTVTGTTVANKTYDGTTNASLSNGALAGVIASDTANIILVQSGNFSDKNVGTGKTVIAIDSLTGSEFNNYSLIQPTGLLANITPKALTVNGTTVTSKVYDATTTASLSNGILVGVIAADAANVTLSQAGNFSDKNVGTSKTIAAADAITGAAASNYSLTQPTGLTANITAKPFTVSAVLNSANKVYDSSRNATVSLTSNDLITNDSLSINYSAFFDNKNTGNGKLVTVGNIGISGTDAGNYLLQNTFTTTLSNITPKSIGLSGVTAQNKIYDATTSATLTGNATVTPLSGDSLTLSGIGLSAFSDASVGVSKSVTVSGFSLIGADAGNYLLTPNLTANITTKALTVTGTTVSSKIYDATTTASLSNGTLVGVIAADIANVALNQTGIFSDKNVGTNKTVTSTDTLSGTAASNYSLTQPSGLIGNITARSLTLNGISVTSKTYDGTSTATLLGNAAVTPLSGDVVSISGTGLGLFADKNTGTNKPVTVSGYTLAGTDAGNYLLTQPSGLTANINKANAVVTGISNSTSFDGTSKTINGFTVNGLATGESTADIARSANNPTGVTASASGKFPGTYLNMPSGTASNYNLSFVSGQLVITGCPGGPPCTAISPQTTASTITPALVPASIAPNQSTAVISNASTTVNTAPVMTFATNSGNSVLGSGEIAARSTNSPSSTATPSNATQNAPSSIAAYSATSSAVTSTATQSASSIPPTNRPNAALVNTTAQSNTGTPQSLSAILSRNNPTEIATALSPTLISQLTPEQVEPLINALSMRQLMALTNDQVSKFDPARQLELLNIIKVLKDNPEKVAEKAFTPADKSFAQLAANGLLKEQMEALSVRVTQLNQNRNAVVIDTPLKLAELLTQKSTTEIAAALPSNLVPQLTSDQVAPLINALSIKQLLLLTNEQISRLEPTRLTELLNTIKVLKDNPEKAFDKTYTAEDKVVAQFAAAGLLRESIERLSLRANYIADNKFRDPLGKELADLINPTASSNMPLARNALAQANRPLNAIQPTGQTTDKEILNLTSTQVAALDPKDLAPLMPQLNVNQLLAITNAQIAKLDERALTQLGLLMNFVQQKAATTNVANRNRNSSSKAAANVNLFVNQPVSRLATNALLDEQSRPGAIAGVPASSPANNPVTVNLSTRQVAELNPAQLAPMISRLNANQLLAITNSQMARLDNSSLNQLNILLNFIQQRTLNASTNIFVNNNQPVARIAAESLMIGQPLAPQIAATTAPIAPVALSPQQIANLSSNQIAPLLNRMNSRQLLAVTDTQMANLDSSNLNQLITLLNFIQDSAKISPVVANNFANRPVASFLPPELNTTQTVTQP